MRNFHRHDNSMKIPKAVRQHWVYKIFLDKRERGRGIRVLDFRSENR